MRSDTEPSYTDREPTYTDTTAAGKSQYANDDRIVDVDPSQTSTPGRRDPDTGESAVHEGR